MNKPVNKDGNGPDVILEQPMTYAEFAEILKQSGFTGDKEIEKEWQWFTEEGRLSVYPEDLEF